MIDNSRGEMGFSPPAMYKKNTRTPRPHKTSTL